MPARLVNYLSQYNRACMKKEADSLYTLNVEDESEFTDAKMDALNSQNV
jgi:hypothetical protein